MIPTDPPSMSLSSEGGNLPRGPVLPESSEDLRIGLMGVINSGGVHKRVVERLVERGYQVDESDLKKNIVGDIGRDANLVILAYDPDRGHAAEIANLFVEELGKELTQLAGLGPQRTLEALETEEPAAWQEYEQRSEELVAFLDGLGSIGLAEDAARLLEERSTVQQALNELAVRDGVARAERPVLERLLAERMPDGETPFVTTNRQQVRNTDYDRALRDAQDKAVQLAQAKLRFRAEHPDVRALAVELEFAEERVREAARDEMITGSATMTLDQHTVELVGRLVEAQIAEASFEPQRQLLEQRAAEIDLALRNVPGYSARETMLRERAMLSRRYAENLSQRRSELRFHLQRGFVFSIFEDSQMADPRQSKAVPSVGGIIVFSLLAGLIVGILLALILELSSQLRLRAPY